MRLDHTHRCWGVVMVGSCSAPRRPPRSPFAASCTKDLKVWHLDHPWRCTCPSADRDTCSCLRRCMGNEVHQSRQRRCAEASSVEKSVGSPQPTALLTPLRPSELVPVTFSRTECNETAGNFPRSILRNLLRSWRNFQTRRDFCPSGLCVSCPSGSRVSTHIPT